jgi:hypothetical protein
MTPTTDPPDAKDDNPWCRALGIQVPALESVVDHPEANTYSMLIVALLEAGEPMTLSEVAYRFEVAGIADRPDARRSLSRCKPDRAPVYRDGDRYHLDPHDHELDLWLFRLGLRPPRVSLPLPPPREHKPVPSPNVPLSFEELVEAWRGASLTSLSAQRVALAVLDAAREPMQPTDVVSFVNEQTKWHVLMVSRAQFGRRGCPVAVLDDGRWAIADHAESALAAVRQVVRTRLEKVRENASLRPDPASIEAARKAYDQRRAAHGAELASKRRALLVGYPEKSPRIATLLDVTARSIETFVGDEIALVRERLESYEIIGAVGVRALLRALSFDPATRRLAELGPPQKSKVLNQRGRTLKITLALLVTGSCGIGRPFGDPSKLDGYLATGQLAKLRARLEADAKSLFAFYEYGRLHGCVRLRWGFLDEAIPAPWVHRDEPTLHDLKARALEEGRPLEVVVGNAPGWSDPWSRGRSATVVTDQSGWRLTLIGEDGFAIADEDVQAAWFGPRRGNASRELDRVEKLTPA